MSEEKMYQFTVKAVKAIETLKHPGNQTIFAYLVKEDPDQKGVMDSTLIKGLGTQAKPTTFDSRMRDLKEAELVDRVLKGKPLIGYVSSISDFGMSLLSFLEYE